MSNLSNLYETDFAEWALRNADLLRTGRLSEADMENIAEEIESLGRSQLHELESRLTQIIEHMLKLTLAPEDLRERNARGWRASIERQRGEIRKLLKTSPSLRRRLNDEVLADCYEAAARTFFAGFEIRPPARSPFALTAVIGD